MGRMTGSAPDGLPDEEAKTGSHLWKALPGVAVGWQGIAGAEADGGWGMVE